MQPRDVQFVNLNMIYRDGVYYRIGPGRLWQTEDITFPQHRFYYIIEGKCTIRINGKTYFGIPGRWFFIPAGVPCGYINDSTKSFAQYWVHFDLIHSNEDLIASLELPAYIDTPTDSPVPKLFSQLNQCDASDMLSDKLKLTSLMFSLFSEYIYRSGDMPVRTFYEKDAKSQKLMRYIERHLQDDLSNTSLASYMHMDVRNFIRYFKQVTGNTPAKYIANLRMARAQTLLTETDMRISDIMYQVGIDDLPLFSKMFKRVYSLSPKAYREMYRKED